MLAPATQGCASIRGSFFYLGEFTQIFWHFPYGVVRCSIPLPCKWVLFLFFFLFTNRSGSGLQRRVDAPAEGERTRLRQGGFGGVTLMFTFCICSCSQFSLNVFSNQFFHGKSRIGLINQSNYPLLSLTPLEVDTPLTPITAA
jgi:hypothetical protein